MFSERPHGAGAGAGGFGGPAAALRTGGTAVLNQPHWDPRTFGGRRRAERTARLPAGHSAASPRPHMSTAGDERDVPTSQPRRTHRKWRTTSSETGTWLREAGRGGGSPGPGGGVPLLRGDRPARGPRCGPRCAPARPPARAPGPLVVSMAPAASPPLGQVSLRPHLRAALGRAGRCGSAATGTASAQPPGEFGPAPPGPTLRPASHRRPAPRPARRPRPGPRAPRPAAP